MHHRIRPMDHEQGRASPLQPCLTLSLGLPDAESHMLNIIV